MKKMAGFTLIELMVVLAIVGILSAIAFPLYNTYTARAQVSEALLFGSAIKMEVSTAYFGQGWTRTTDYSLNNSTQFARYLESATVDKDGVITMKMGANADSAIRGKTLTLVPTMVQNKDSGSVIQWNCEPRGNNPIPANYLPTPCR